MRELDFFIEMCESEQRVQLSGHLPSVESYNRRRMGSGAVGVLLAIHEYVPSSLSKFVLNLTHTTPLGTHWRFACHNTLSIVPP